MFRSITIMFAVLVVTGCASITTGQDQPVSVETPACPAASCKLTNKDGTYYIPTTPGTVQVNRACGKLTLQCSKDGADDFIMTVSSSVKAMAFGNIIFGGLIGAGVDTVTGAACEYPDLIPVPMDCGGSSASATQDTPENVAASATELGCEAPRFLSRSVQGADVYTTDCNGAKMLLTCDDKGCKASEYAVGDDS